MKGTAIYPSPMGDIQLDWEDGAVTALKNADRAAKADVPNEKHEEWNKKWIFFNCNISYQRQ